MWQKIKCWWLGHNWKQQGCRVVEYYFYNHKGERYKETEKDHLLFMCTKCHEFWEYECQVSYIKTDDMHKKPENFNTSEKHAQESNI